MMTYLLLPLFWIGRYFARKKKPEILKDTEIEIAYYYHAAAFLFLGLFLFHVFGFFIPLIKLGEQMALGFPDSLVAMKYVHWGMAFTSIVLLGLSVQLWVKRKSTSWFRIYYSAFSLITFSYILILYRWHFLHVVI